MAQYKELDGQTYRVCTVKYNGIWVSDALIPEKVYKTKKLQKTINNTASKKGGRSYWRKKLWKVFSEFIRARDDYTCVTCGAIGKDSSKYVGGDCRVMQAGHYLPKGSYPGLYFHDQDVYAQCAYCNMRMEDPEVQERFDDFMQNKIGDQGINYLKIIGKQATYSTSDLELLYSHYKKRLDNF